MTTVFPGAIDSLPRPLPTTKTNAGSGLNLSTVIDNISDAIEAIEAVLGAGIPGANPIINGGMNLWSDGTPFTSIASGTWGPDGWIYTKGGAVVHDLLRSTDVPAVAKNAQKANYSLQLDVTTVDSSIAAGDFCTIATRLEGYAWLPLAQRQFSLSFWVKAAKTGVHCVYFRNSGSDRCYVAEYSVSVADTWEYKTITVPDSPAAGTWDYTNGRGLEIGWTLSAGSTFHTTAGAWQTGNFLGTANQVNETDNVANNFRIWGAMLTLGASAAPFVGLPHAVEEYRARRYHEVFGGVGNSMYGTGFVNTTSTVELLMPVFPKRATPTVSVATVGNLLAYTSGSTFTALTAFAIIGGSDRTLWLRGTVAGTPFTVGQGAALVSSGGEAIKFSARIP